MTLHAGGVRRLLHADQVEERAALEAVERTGRDALADMRRLLGVLRSAEPGGEAHGPAPGLAQVGGLLEPARAAGLAADARVTGEARPLPPAVELTAYRIVQEAVTNVLRHAAARRVSVTLDYARDALRLRVEDDGTGPAGAPRVSGVPGASHAPGHGHVGMRERAAVYGGTVEAGPLPGGGYAVTATIPLPGRVPAVAPPPVSQRAP